MNIVIRPSSNRSRVDTDFIQKRLEFALGRFSGRIRSLNVRLTDVNGPKGGATRNA